MRILVVEDEEGIADALQRGLSADGFAVDVANDGIDGLHMARSNPYVAIVLDIMLPGMNGYKVCQTLREEEIWTPIVMLTAKDGEYDEMEGLDTGADDYVTKPFSYQVLLSRLRAVIRRSESGRPAHEVLTVGELELSPSTQVASFAGHVLDMSPRAFAVLEYLMHQQGLVVSKDQILDNVWDHAFEGDPNIVEVYISRLRGALDGAVRESGSSRPVRVETVRGVGYRLMLGKA